jgi:hypothetical protein
MQAKRRCTVEAPDADDIWALSMDSEFNMDSSWKLAEWRRRVRLVITCTATSTWIIELRVRTERDQLRGRDRMRCARRPPPATYWGMFYYRGHHWRVLKCTLCRFSCVIGRGLMIWLYHDSSFKTSFFGIKPGRDQMQMSLNQLMTAPLDRQVISNRRFCLRLRNLKRWEKLLCSRPGCIQASKSSSIFSVRDF